MKTYTARANCEETFKVRLKLPNQYTAKDAQDLLQELADSGEELSEAGLINFMSYHEDEALVAMARLAEIESERYGTDGFYIEGVKEG